MRGWNTKRLMAHWRKMKVKNWQIFALLALLLLLSAYLLRQNNLRMIEIREAVIAADENGVGVGESIERLNRHVFRHMNTEIVRPVELVHTYNRQAKAVIEAASKSSGRDVYAEATRACERQGIPITNIAQCAADYALSNNPTATPQEITLPDKNRFIYTFASPIWAPDLAGFSVLATGVVLIWFVLRLVEYIAVRLVIRRRYHRVF